MNRLKHRRAAISISSRFMEAGGLLTCGPSRPVYGQRLGFYIDGILEQASPGNLPIEQPAKCELVVDRQTARALGLTLPQSLLGRADRVIE